MPRQRKPTPLQYCRGSFAASPQGGSEPEVQDAAQFAMTIANDRSEQQTCHATLRHNNYGTTRWAVTLTSEIIAEACIATGQKCQPESNEKEIYYDLLRSQFPTVEFKTMVNDLVAKLLGDFLL